MVYWLGILCSFWAAVILWALGAPAALFVLAVIPLVGITLMAVAPRLLRWVLLYRITRLLRRIN